MDKISIAGRIGQVEYAIREVALAANQVAKSGKKIIPLNIGDPVKFDFKTPDHIKEALFKAVREDHNMYSSSEGLLELREAISEKLASRGTDVSEDDIIVTTGISEGIQMLMGVLVEEGDEVLVPVPTYPSYESYTKFFGGTAVHYLTMEDEGWVPDIDDLRRKITPKSKAILLINPNNPTGAIISEKILREIVQVAGEHGVPIITDEIYDEILFDGSHIATASVAKDVSVIGLNGFSKAHLMTGWRLGYVYFHGVGGKLDEVKEGVLRMARMRLCSNTPVQMAGVSALRGPQDHIKDMVSRLRARRDLCLRIFRENDLMSSTVPQGAFYLFPKVNLREKWSTDKDFVIDLLKETGVSVVHGSGFGEDPHAGYFRMIFLPPLSVLEEALSNIMTFLQHRNRNK